MRQDWISKIFWCIILGISNLDVFVLDTQDIILECFSNKARRLSFKIGTEPYPVEEKYIAERNQTYVKVSGNLESQDNQTCYHSMEGFYPLAKKLWFLAPLAKGQRAIVMALCPSCVCPSVRSSVRVSVNFFFKKLLLRNYWLDFNQISQECSLGGPLSNSFK